jgi:hypothetical protein
MGEAFDADPRFEGVAFQETALGIDGHVLDATGYTPERYRDALITTLQNATEALPRSRIFWYANFLPRGQAQLGVVAAAVTPYGVAVGGPDVLPDRVSLQRHVYPFLRELGSDVIVFNSAQNDSFSHVHQKDPAATRYWTPTEILAYARDNLKVRYLFWNRVPNPKPADSYDIEDAYPAMLANPLASDEELLPRAPRMGG